MERRKETQEGEQFSSSPMLTRQVIEVNRRIENFDPIRAFGKIYALWSDLPQEVRERAKPRISMMRAKMNGVDEKYIEEAKELGFTGGYAKGKRDYGRIYHILCENKLEPKHNWMHFDKLPKVRDVWMRIRDVIKDSGLLDDETRTIMAGAEE